jgi:regulator of protease activity HflC (stomatin/prohibitin superfamily)
MVTGDGNLIELQATVRYTIADPRAFLFETREPEQIVRAVTEAALRETAAGAPFLNLLTIDRQRIQAVTLERIRELCGRYGNIGIRFDGLALHDLHPPQEVVPAYHDVARAMEARERQINEAVAQALSKKRSTQAQSVQIVRQAGADKHEKVSQADAAGSEFAFRQSERKKLSLHQELTILSETLWASWQRGPDGSAAAEHERRREAAVALQSKLTDFRLYWNALGKALTGREKIIIDADHVPGKRHLLLFDPEQWRVPAPLLTPSERTSPLRRESRLPVQEEGQ